MSDSTCRTCRAAGEKLFLKGEKCFSPKCTFNKKPYAPGTSGARGGRRRKISQFGKQLQEKQKVRNMYGLRERQFARYVKEAMEKRNKEKAPAEALFGRLETRLDNVVYRAGFAPSRRMARQLVSHGHILVNGRRMNIASHRLSKGDVITIREGSRGDVPFANLSEKLEKTKQPSWLTLDTKALSARVERELGAEETNTLDMDFASVIEYYSR